MKKINKIIAVVIALFICVEILLPISIAAQSPIEWPQLSEITLADGAALKSKKGNIPINYIQYKNYTEIQDGGTDDDWGYPQKIVGEVTVYVKEALKKVVPYSLGAPPDSLTCKIKVDLPTPTPDGMRGYGNLSNTFDAGTTSDTVEVADCKDRNTGNFTLYCYTVNIVVGFPNDVTCLAAGDVIDFSDTETQVKFTSNTLGKYYYTVLSDDATAPTEITENETDMVAGENTISLTNLGTGAKKIYISAKGNNIEPTKKPLVINIPDFDSFRYEVLLSCSTTPTNYNGVLSATVDGNPIIPEQKNQTYYLKDIKKGQKIKVWVNVPDCSKDLDTVSIITDDVKRTPIEATVNSYNSFTFTMPNSNVRSAFGSNWMAYKSTTALRHTLSYTADQIELGLGNNSRFFDKCIVEFTDINGKKILQAAEGTQVTAKTIESPEYDISFLGIVFKEWSSTGVTIPAEEKLKDPFTFTMGNQDVSLHANFDEVGTSVSWQSNPPEAAIISIMNFKNLPVKLKKGSKLVAFLNKYELDQWIPWYSDQYEFIGWKIEKDGIDVSSDESVVTYQQPGNPSKFEYYEIPDFIVGGDILSLTANFRERLFSSVNVSANDISMGSATITIDDSTNNNLPVVYEGKTVTLTATPNVRYILESWTVTDEQGSTITVTPDQSDSNKATFVMPNTGKAVTAVANFKVDPQKASTECMINSVSIYDSTGQTKIVDANKSGTNFNITLPGNTTFSPDMILKLDYSEYAKVKKDGEQPADWKNGQPNNMTKGQATTFTVIAEDSINTQNYTVTINETLKNTQAEITTAALYDSTGTTKVADAVLNGKDITITLPNGTNFSPDMILRLISSKNAYVSKVGNDVADWSTGQPCGMTLETVTSFNVTSEDMQSTNTYNVKIMSAKQTGKDITAVELLNKNKAVIAKGTLSGSTWTVTLPEGTDSNVISSIGSSADYFLKITHNGASVMQEEGWDDANGEPLWNNGDVMCTISVNNSALFTVKDTDGTTKDYTIAIACAATNKPDLIAGEVIRNDNTTATVKFTTNEAGTYFYKVVSSDASAPNINTNSGGNNATIGENTITLTNLTTGAKNIYIIVKNAAGIESSVLKIDIPSFTESNGAYKITVSAPTGGILIPNKNTANAGETITISVTPNTGMQMTSDSLTYTLAVAGGETVKIVNNSFVMPSCDITITCKWETAITKVDGITKFTINNVAGTINNTTNTITIMMPYGTDIKRLTPTVIGSNIANISPSSGATIDFSRPVTYMVTLNDGSVKSYVVMVYLQSGSESDKMWDKLTNFYYKIPWWELANYQISTDRYPTYW